MECKKCKKEIKDGTKVCPYCGERIAPLKSVFEINEDISEEELEDTLEELDSVNNINSIPITEAAKVVVPVEQYVSSEFNDDESFESPEIFNQSNPVVIETEQNMVAPALEIQNNNNGIDDALIDNLIATPIDEPFESLEGEPVFESSENDGMNEVVNRDDDTTLSIPMELEQAEERIGSDNILIPDQNTDLNNENIVNVFIDEPIKNVDKEKVNEDNSYNRRVFLVVKVVIMVLILGLIAFVAFKMIAVDDKTKPDEVIDDTLIIDGLNMGTYYETKNDEKLDYVSKLTFNEDKTFLLLANTCESITELSGNYSVEDDKVILVLNDFDENGQLINTKLTFHIVDDYQLWLEEDYFCVTNAANDGIFIYRK